MSVRLRITCMVALCAMLSSTALVLGAGIAAACSGTGGGGCTAPTVSTGSATVITSNSATLNGSVNPQGCLTTYAFEYGRSSEGYPNEIGSSAGSGTSPVSVQTYSGLGLQPSTSYHFRLAAWNSGGETTGGSGSFTTTGGTEEACLKPTVTTEIPAGVTAGSAVLGGIVDPHGCSATYWFEWGPSSQPNSYLHKTATHSAGTARAFQAEDLKGLLPGTGYHFRLSANNSAGTTPGADKTFTTKTTTKDPILFVHGWKGNVQTWTTMIQRFESQGWPDIYLRNFAYDSARSNVSTADLVAAQVASLRSVTGAAKVDIITHSMGALSSRYYLKHLGGTAFVEDWVSLAGPNHGTNAGYACQLTEESCIEMQPGSTFLTDLNSGDETPGSVRYETVRSECDPIINPDNSVILSGAILNLAWFPTTCITSHSGIHEDSNVFAWVESFVH
jgi:triacylglycerol lipase